MVTPFLKHLAVLGLSVLFSAAITYVVMTRFVVSTCSCHETDTAQEEFSADLKITDYLAGSIDWNPPLYYQQKLARLDKNPTDQKSVTTYAETLVGLGKVDEAIKVVEEAGNLDWILGRLYFFKWAKNKFNNTDLGKKSAAHYAKYIKHKPSQTGQAEIEHGLVKMKLGALFYGNSETRISEWNNLLVTWGPARVRDTISLLILEMDENGDPDLFTNLARIGSGSEEEALGSRFMLLQKVGFDFGVDSENLYAKDDLKEIGGYQRNENAGIAVNELATWGSQYRENRTNFMLSKLNAGSHPDTDPHFWDGYKVVDRPDLKKYGTWVPKIFRDLNLFSFGLLPIFIGLSVLTFAFITACGSIHHKLKSRKLQLQPRS